MDTTVTTTRCAWCGAAFDYDEHGGTCPDCRRETCCDCGSRIAHELPAGIGVIDGGAAVFHLGTDCRWAEYWGWSHR